MALSNETIAELRQERINQIAAEKVHTRRLGRLTPWVTIVDILTIVIPILYFAPKLLAKKPDVAAIVENVDIALSVALLALAVLRLILGWDARIRAHSNGIVSCIRTARTARTLLTDGNATDEGARWFLNGAAEPRPEDELIRERSESERRLAYRLALREFEPGSQDAVCGTCKASVWNFKKGNCGVCGNIPNRQIGDP